MVSSGNIILKLWNIQSYLPSKRATAVKKQTVQWIAAPYFQSKVHYGDCENTFKEHYNKEKCSFRDKSRETSKGLLKYIWELKAKDCRKMLVVYPEKQEIFADYESVLYVFVRSSLLENQ